MIFPPVDPELLRSLPPVLGAVVRALGFGRARDFLQQHGGVNVVIPLRKHQALNLSAEELQRIRDTLHPHMDHVGRVWMPKPDKLFIRTRNAQIRKDRHKASINAQAKRYRLSSRQIQNIRGAAEEVQRELF
jgi:Flp pilus assembly secretin CpaC